MCFNFPATKTTQILNILPLIFQIPINLTIRAHFRKIPIINFHRSSLANPPARGWRSRRLCARSMVATPPTWNPAAEQNKPSKMIIKCELKHCRAWIGTETVLRIKLWVSRHEMSASDPSFLVSMLVIRSITIFSWTFWFWCFSPAAPQGRRWTSRCSRWTRSRRGCRATPDFGSRADSGAFTPGSDQPHSDPHQTVQYTQ